MRNSVNIIQVLREGKQIGGLVLPLLAGLIFRSTTLKSDFYREVERAEMDSHPLNIKEKKK